MNDLLYDLIRYVDLEMFFDKYDDFVKRAKRIRKKYKELDYDGIRVYKTYVYEKDFDVKLKDHIWKFINGDLNYEHLPKKEGSKNQCLNMKK